MYATLHRRTGAPPAGHDPALRLRQIGGPTGLTVQLWPARPADPTAFEVVEDRGLAEPAAPPAAASVLTFGGPLSDDVLRAAERAGRERIAPAMEGHPGAVRLITLWQPEQRRQVVITLATSLEALEEGSRRIGELPLLPGEDIALLPGPDHVEMFRVESSG
jgi:plasmid stabilization system protein ParE